MAQAGLHIAFSKSLLRYIPYEKRLYPAFIFGAILPDLDALIVAIGTLFYSIHESIFIFHRTFSHSFFTIILIYLVFSVLAEWKNKSSLKSIGKGLALGMLTHISIDTFLWFREIHFLWPLPIKSFNLWSLWTIPDWIHKSMLVLEFFCFRWYAWFLITNHLKNPSKESWIIVYLNTWKKIETIFFVTFIILSFLNIKSFMLFFGLAYIFSIISALIATFISRNTFETKFLT